MKRYFISIVFVCFTCSLYSQKILLGIIKDQHSGEPVPFASVYLKKAGAGKLADSSGAFAFHFPVWPKDTLIISNVGFQDYKYFIDAVAIKADT
ncbi:MAG: carboxypeptidase-like regulatory domain-containing protein, partial [Chitinophagaceae bacterium]|nr:carboxypeptidase-like regulatory domain-containing protein [Chitinophagaceae bacterium]